MEQHLALLPVPAALRALAGKQLRKPTAAMRTLPQWLIHLGRLHRTMQEIMLERVKPVHALTQAPNEQNCEWQRRLAEFDQSRKALGEAYNAYLQAAPHVADLLATWRQERGIGPEERFTYEQDDDALVLYLQPALAQVQAKTTERMQQALDHWIAATHRYFRLLDPPPLRSAA
ncbi:hypothetical protein [Hymenobacter sp. AT01-02]|uniref:hypothetical protein n=1 Tax=Hymenobacter sp. AT01-02 TaxID=1571877 RepID=UPI0005F163B9|nr:hypothetical protein [Hymenobacter sp. AT01-02]